MARYPALMAVIALFVAQAIIRFDSRLCTDSSWFVVVAQGLLAGKKLYFDFIEVNPPLGIWLVVPPVWLAGKLSLGVIPVFYAYVFALIAASVAMVRRYVQGPEQGWVTLAAAMALLFLPAANFTQREHFAAIMFLPWLMLRIFQPTGIHPLERFLAGAVAGLGIAIKPYSIFTPVIVEAFALWDGRNWRPLLAAENLGGVIAVAAYVGIVAFFTPEYFRTIVALGQSAYLPYYGDPAAIVCINFGPAALLAWVARKGWKDRTVRSFLAATLGFAVSYFLQFKGFSYQALPAAVTAFIAGAAAVASVQDRRLAIAFASASALLLFMISQYFKPETTIAEALRDVDLSRRPSVFIASSRMGDGFPLALENQLPWVSRYPTQWLARYASAHWQKGEPVDDPIVKYMLATEMDDFLNGRPDLLVIDETPLEVRILGGQFHFLEFWDSDPRFAAFWQDYRLKSNQHGWLVYTRK